jgi:serine protease AprX
MILTVRRRPVAALTAVVAAALTWMVAAPMAGSPTGHVVRTPVAVDPGLHAVQGTVGLIVRGARSVESAVVRMGGRVTHDLPLIHGFSATVPAGDLDRIARIPGVTSLTLDRSTKVMGSVTTTTSSAGLNSVYRHVVRADSLGTVGGDGHGVTVALIDTGVTPLPDVANALVSVKTDPLGLTSAPCINFSDEPTCDDSYGHGTFLAGLIAGNGHDSNGLYAGTAPGAKIVSIKIAGADGSADVSTIIAAIQWVVSFKDTYGIRVLNLSLGTDSTQSYTVDPLDYAVERAWNAGIVVDVSASNRGPAAGTISKPADDPFVVTVGAIDDRGTNGLGDDTLPDFSGRGPTAADGLAKPDVVAPGAHLVSLAAPGAAITTQFPPNMPAPYRRGSGTSMSTAVVSGLVADMLSARPTMSPNRVKFALMSTARNDASNDRTAVGAGLVDGYNAAFNAPLGLANQGVTPSSGTGSLAASRGTTGVVLNDVNGTVLSAASGDLTQQLLTWNPTTLLTDPWSGTSWYGTSWYGTSWYGTSWYGTSWYGTSWYGTSWYGTPDGTSWYGTSWYGGSWYGAWDQ